LEVVVGVIRAEASKEEVEGGGSEGGGSESSLSASPVVSTINKSSFFLEAAVDLVQTRWEVTRRVSLTFEGRQRASSKGRKERKCELTP